MNRALAMLEQAYSWGADATTPEDPPRLTQSALHSLRAASG
jgi:hypothetical protein